MIISASRRTDLPAFYAPWFMNRIRAGFCTVPNPFDRSRVATVSLAPADVEVIVFWTRNPRPLLPHLAELTAWGYRYYFQYTLMVNPTWLDPQAPPIEISLKNFRDLAEAVGPEKVIWRYDPIVFTDRTNGAFHRETYGPIARALKGYTRRSVISIVDLYRKTGKRLGELSNQRIEVKAPDRGMLDELMPALADLARENGLEIVSCAEEIDLQPYGIQPGKCIDDGYIKEVFALEVIGKKDPSQRKACGCVVSRDIGMYDSCLYGCRYCYATTSFDRARVHHANHDLLGTSLVT